MNGLPNIQCAACGKPVDRVEAWRNEHDMSTTFKVWCHGAKDLCRIPDSFLVCIGREGVAQMASGVAFTAQGLALEQNGTGTRISEHWSEQLPGVNRKYD